jgi:hypothetical protein
MNPEGVCILELTAKCFRYGADITEASLKDDFRWRMRNMQASLDVRLSDRCTLHVDSAMTIEQNTAAPRINTGGRNHRDAVV